MKLRSSNIKIARFTFFLIILTITTTACGTLSNPATVPQIPGLEGTLAARTLTALDALRPAVSTPEPHQPDSNSLAAVDFAPDPPQNAVETSNPTSEMVESEQTSEPKTAICTNRAEFIEDISIPDNSKVSGGERFTKTWRFKNVGTCMWTAEYTLVFIWGDQMAGRDRLSIGKKVPPGETIDVSVDLVAPTDSNTYQGNWMFEDTYGNRFGTGYQGRQFFWVAINVGGGGGRGGIFGSDSGPCISGG